VDDIFAFFSDFFFVLLISFQSQWYCPSRLCDRSRWSSMPPRACFRTFLFFRIAYAARGPPRLTTFRPSHRFCRPFYSCCFPSVGLGFFPLQRLDVGSFALLRRFAPTPSGRRDGGHCQTSGSSLHRVFFFAARCASPVSLPFLSYMLRRTQMDSAHFWGISNGASDLFTLAASGAHFTEVP